MKLLQCQYCGQVLHFENTVCLRCGHSLGYLPERQQMLAMEPDGPFWKIAQPDGPSEEGRWRFCHNWELSACNWMVPAGEASDPEAGDDFCIACRHNRTVPDLTDPVNHARWQRLEAAKRRLIYALERFGLPHPAPGEGHSEPLQFDFLSEAAAPGEVMTGHAGGLVTISLAEADDAEREKRRIGLNEAYRTLLGHFRHEVGHYYWDLLVRDGDRLDAFRALFGDERTDYGAALDRHYREGAPAGWEGSHVSAYATMHPWEDWAETWAHYLHMVDTLETAAAAGMSMAPDLGDDGRFTVQLDFNPYRTDSFARLISAWMPLTVALNALNRSMGHADPYPFVLPDPVQEKLRFVHDLVSAARQ